MISTATSTALWLRRLGALALLFASFWIWTLHSDVIELIVRQRPVLFGRYSQGHFGALLIVTPILWALAAAFAARTPLLRTLGNTLLGIAITLIAIVAVTYLAHFFHRDALYVETERMEPQEGGQQLAVKTRHRPPNQVYELTFEDKPEQARSYPDAPPGFEPVPLRLTSDKNGFRNTSVAEQYDIIAVGDSFVAGSNVSDDQTWPALLGTNIGRPIYNLGVGGSGPPVYLANFSRFGVPLKPRVALFMIYEGNDFKEDVVVTGARPPTLWERISKHVERAFDASPVTLGLKRLSHDLFEKLGSQRPVPGYRERLGFMPIAIASGDIAHHYSFDPKRLIYLNYSREEFAASREWKATAGMLEQIVQASRANGIRPVFIYAPSTPHVVLPLVWDAIPADQLRNFAGYRKSRLPPPAEFKQQVKDNLDSEQDVVMEFCARQQIECLALTDALRNATASGRQTYFSYDQHWTPVGNAVAANAIEAFLRERGLL
jgi:membrane protein implicated in regulation of membrane protease activity